MYLNLLFDIFAARDVIPNALMKRNENAVPQKTHMELK